MQAYDLIFAIKPDLAKEEMDGVISSIKGFIEERKGEITTFDEWGMKKLAYPVKNYYEANYFLVIFKSLPKHIKDMKDILRFNDAILRSSIVKLDRELGKIVKKIRKKPVEDRPKKKFFNGGDKP